MAGKTDSGQILKGLLDTLVLDLLADGDNYGFGIFGQLLDRLGPDKDLIKEASLYPLLYRLEKRGYLAAYHAPGERGSPRKYYRLTGEGQAFLEMRRNEWRRMAGVLERTLFSRTGSELQQEDKTA
ncbi:helix-turn-helix transcriptional regulator [Wenzhouxiangella sp. AB-CW3]|uniref:PadR family transcriptional regulator n=1 Tax=Wenzhouxiangella sp. AB-CW3 TaxID=2771012 RepID=UPI00168B1D2B|nr:helix-turn-helix transcriptional regulator [Wenzhouxiangella sp. AB-CW3]QOC22391.1 helix-turn-helix transcriptional regulator [Wenzhouxiangella sp. AB-CW3]